MAPAVSGSDDKRGRRRCSGRSILPLSPVDYRNRVLPTRLGNILLAGECYAHSRYNIDVIYFWTWLYPLPPETFQHDHEIFEIQYQFPLVVAFQATVAPTICAVILLVTHSPAVVFSAIPLGGVAIAYGAVRFSLSSAIDMAEHQRAAFDLYRPLLSYVWVVVVWYGSWRLTGPQVSMMVARAAWALWKP